jgi:CheY-like chemotaxis protein
MAKRILIVDDDSDALALISLTLRRRGYEIMTAPGGAEALEILAGDLPDLLLLDLMMPFMDGYEVCSRLRADPRTASLPIIMLTAKAQVASRIEGLRLGVDDYVTKPVHPDELVSRICAALDRAVEARAHQGTKGSLIACVGCKGGVGTTTLAVNVALALARRGEVVLADFLGDAMVYFGQLPFDQLVTLSKLDVDQINRAAIERAWVTHASGVHVLHDVELLANQARAEVVFSRVPDMADFCLLDLGAWAFAAQPSRQWILEKCKAIALMVAPGQVEIERGRRILKQLDEWSITTPVHLVWVSRQATIDPAEVTALGNSLGRAITNVIPYAPELTSQVIEQASLLVTSQPDSPAARALQELADTLVRDP